MAQAEADPGVVEAQLREMNESAVCVHGLGQEIVQFCESAQSMPPKQMFALMNIGVTISEQAGWLMSEMNVAKNSVHHLGQQLGREIAHKENTDKLNAATICMLEEDKKILRVEKANLQEENATLRRALEKLQADHNELRLQMNKDPVEQKFAAKPQIQHTCGTCSKQFRSSYKKPGPKTCYDCREKAAAEKK